MREYTSFQTFWPYYLREHSDPKTRAWHYVGSSLAIAILIFALATQSWKLLFFMPLAGYFFAWVSHAFIEHNKPATFTYPLWSLISDFKMLFCFLTGKLGGELIKAGVKTAPT